jgi:hypothetical protein
LAGKNGGRKTTEFTMVAEKMLKNILEKFERGPPYLMEFLRLLKVQ